MLNPDKINKSLLQDIASNLGWEKGEPIGEYKARIAQLTPREALRRFAAWHLGDSEWANVFIDNLETLQKAEVK